VDDYDAAQYDPPLETLADVQVHDMSDRSDSNLSMVVSDSPLFLFQSIEKLSYFCSFGAYKCHLKSRKMFPELARNESNMMAGSWTPFHQALDGLLTPDGVPALVIEFDEIVCEEVVGVAAAAQRRFRVNLVVEFRTEDVENEMKHRFKEGTERLGDLRWRTFVHVQDAETFRECVEWKCCDTRGMWTALSSSRSLGNGSDG